MESLKIYIDRLKDGQKQKIEETLPPDFLDVTEEELVFEDPVHVQAEAYLAEDHLVIHLNIETAACLPCCICNDTVRIPVIIKNIYLTEPLEEIKGAIYDCTNATRESILLQTPRFAECNSGKCPEREHVKKFINNNENSSSEKEITHFPFADL